VVLVCILGCLLPPAGNGAQLLLTWTDNSSNETGFLIERAANGGSFSQVVSTVSNVTSYTDSNLADSTDYSYRIRAYSGTLFSAYTGSVTARTRAQLQVEANTAPTVSSVVNRSVEAQSSTGAIPFTTSDSATPASSLTVTATSSNLSLVPASAIVLGGNGTSRTITVTPPGTLSGTTTVTIRVSDGGLSTSTTFALTVTPLNLAPTVTAIASRTVESPASTGPIPFTIGDTQTAASRLVVSGTSSNTALVPNSAIIFSGSGANRTVTITPVGTLSGSATITVRVSDGALSTSRAFVLSVTPENLPPTVTPLASRTVESPASTGPIAFTISDTQTAASRLVVSGTSSNTALVPYSAIVFGGSGANRTVSVTPNASATGTTLISLTVFDGVLSTTTAFSLTVIPFTAPPVISGVSNLSTSVNGLVQAPFTIDDSDTPLDLLKVTATSSNASLLRSSSLILGGAAHSRTLNALLNPGASGTTLITLSVNDGVKTTNLQITLTVLTANTVPWIEGLTNLTTRSNFLAGQPFTAGDAETSASSLAITATSSNPLLIANSSIRLGANGLQRAIAMIPSRGRTGTALITVMISDGVLSSTRTFTVQVTP